MKSKIKNKLLAFVKEAIRAAIAAVAGVAGAALAGCTAVFQSNALSRFNPLKDFFAFLT